ncbi:MAG: glycosyltransferase family 4 protein, partial [Acidimicrobiales bacterium]
MLTTPYAGDTAFDRDQPFRVVRSSERVLGPAPTVVDQVRRLVDETGARLVVLDPALPLGLAGGRLGCPYAVVVHGAELSIPSRLPGGRALMRRVLRG